MAFTYDPTTDQGRVRMLIPDRDEQNVIFQDVEIQAYLDLNEGNVKRAAAEALETVASDQALVLKVITTLGLSTNGAAVANSLLERSKMLRDSADKADAADGGLFDYAEMPNNAFTKRERVWKQWQRDSEQ